ncbi:MAG: PUA domain-containing protein, partial [Thermoplasmata archaeon]
DSSAYQKFARRGRLLFPEGTVAIEDLVEPVCRCPLCAELPLAKVAGLPPAEREPRIALHNLLTSAEEMARVRQAIRQGTLWELAERRSVAHPALRAGLEEMKRHAEVFLATEPESRPAFREIDRSSRDRPAVVRFRRRLDLYRRGRPPSRTVGRLGLRPEYLQHVPLEDSAGQPLRWETATPLGLVPLELTDLYPVGPYLGVDEFLDPPRHRPPRQVREEIEAQFPPGSLPDRDWTEAWTRFQTRQLLEWQYGGAVAEVLGPVVRGERSRRTGRLRGISGSQDPWFVIGTDGVPHPTYRGAQQLHPLIPAPARRVVVQGDAVPFVRAGRTLFSRFVAGADPDLVPGSSALLVDDQDELLAVGRLLLAPHEMRALARGVAVRISSHATSPAPEAEDASPDPAADSE